MNRDVEQNLPAGWATTTIGGLVGADGEFVDGDWVESKDQDPNGDVRLIQLADVGDGKYLDKSSRFLTSEKAEQLRCTFLEKGDVLIARMPDPLGRACIFQGDSKKSVTVVDVCIVRTGRFGANHRWLVWFVNAPDFRSRVAGLQSGSTRKRISRGNLATILLPVPPLKEQLRIADEIEKQFTRLDAAVTALKRVQANLKRYRAAVLKAACEGRLVPTEAELARREGRSYEPASELLKRILADRRSRWEAAQLTKGRTSKPIYKRPSDPVLENLYELPRGWDWSTLGAVAEIKLGKMLSPKAYEEGLVQLPYLRNENVRWGHIDFDDVKLMGFKQGELERYQLQPNDLVVCEGGEAGRCAVYEGESGAYMYQKALHRVRIFGAAPSPYFIQFCFRHFVLSGKVIPRPSETTIQHLPLEEMERLPVPIPPIKEQDRIVSEVERRLSIRDELETQVIANVKRAERLRQAILKDAFEGKLAPQDPNDEPASALLERIRALKETSKSDSVDGKRMLKAAKS
jgi:type I restriction enzyme S subunit